MKNSPLSSFRSTINSPKKSILKSHRISEIIEPTHHPKYNFSEFTNFATVIKDAEMQDRRNTCNAFLKNKELEEFTQNFAVKKSALYEIKRDLTFDQLTSLQSLSSIDWKKKPSYKKGIMYINELWSDRHYKSVVNSSDLKPKTDMVIMQKKIKLFSDMLKDIDIAYKKIKKFNPKDQRDILNTYFNEAETKKQLSNSLTQSTNLFPGPSHRINRSNIAFNLNQNFTQNLINYEKSIVSCSLEDLLQKLQIFAKLESSEKSQELKSMFKKVIHEKMETVDIYNEKELQQSRNYKNRMMSHYVQNKHSRIKQSSVVSGLQAMHSSPKKKINQDNDNKNKLSFEAIISENNRVSGNLNLNTFDQNNLCKSIGFRRNLSKKSTRKIDNKTDKNEIRLLRQNSEENDNDDEEEYNIYQRSGSTNYIKTEINNENKMINKPRGISNFGRNFSAKIETPLKSESPKLKIEKNTQKLISKCENLKDQNFELLQQLNLGLKLKEINKTKQFKDNINRQEKILNDINLYVNATLKKQKPDVSKKEKEKLALKKVLQSYYVGYDPDEDDN